MNQHEVIGVLGELRPNCTFLSVRGYRNEEGEVSDYNVCFHISYKNVLERSIALLEEMNVAEGVESQAKEELLESFRSSLAKMAVTPVEEINDTYERFFDSEGRHIAGVKMHKEKGDLHLFGLLVKKNVLVEGNYKEVKSRPLTIAKNKLRRSLPVGKWRQFVFSLDKVDSIKVEKMEIMPSI